MVKEEKTVRRDRRVFSVEDLTDEQIAAIERARMPRHRHLDAELEGIELGLLDVKAGRVVPHDKAMMRMESTIKSAKRRKR